MERHHTGLWLSLDKALASGHNHGREPEIVGSNPTRPAVTIDMLLSKDLFDIFILLDDRCSFATQLIFPFVIKL